MCVGGRGVQPPPFQETLTPLCQVACLCARLPCPRDCSLPQATGHQPVWHKPFAWSPWSFFFWERPVLRVLDQEKKAPFRFFSLSSSPRSSFRDLPDFDFPFNCHPMESYFKMA